MDGKEQETSDPYTKYGRRPRRKTKPDKYEYHGKAERTGHVQKRRRTKYSTVATRDFHAANVDAERVTLKAKQEQFIFSRSKMSLPMAGQDLPDLTFTRMKFLSQLPDTTERVFTKNHMERHKKVQKPLSSRKAHTALPAPHLAISQNQSNVMPSVFCIKPSTKSGPENNEKEGSFKSYVDGPELNESIERPCWARNRSDSRIEEYLPVETTTISSSPISWSASPRSFRDVRSISVPLKDVTRLSEVHSLSSRSIFRGKSRTTVTPQTKCGYYVDTAVEGELPHRNVIPVHSTLPRHKFPKIHSLEDLKRMRDENTQTHLPDPLLPRQLASPKSCAEVETKSESFPDGTPHEAPYCAHGPLFNTDDNGDNISRWHQNRLASSHSARQRNLQHGCEHRFQRSGACAGYQSSCNVSENSLTKQSRSVDQSVPSGSSYGKRRENDHGDYSTVQQTASKLAETEWKKATFDGLRSECDANRRRKWEDRLDLFDLELLEAISAADRRHDSPHAAREYDPAKENNVTRVQGRARDMPSGSLTASEDDLTREMRLQSSVRTESSDDDQSVFGFRLHKPSSRLKSLQQEFNPFKRAHVSR